MSSYCVFYSYFETPNSIRNLQFFIKNGISTSEDVLFVIVINNHKCSVEIPSQDNVKVVLRDNLGHDFGSWKDGLESVDKNFDYYIFMNDTVCGPFLPRYVPKSAAWYEMFCSLISEKVKLSGLTINSFPWAKSGGKYEHVQSMMFCTDMVGLQIISKNIFNLSSKNYQDIYRRNRKSFIQRFEIGLSQQIIRNGFEIAALYVCNIKKRKTGDVWYNNRYFKTTVNPFETMFIKSKRISSGIINLYLESFA